MGNSQQINGNLPYNYYKNLSSDDKNQILNSIFNDPNYSGIPVAEDFTYSNVNSNDKYAADDGKISFMDKAGSFLKGVVSPVTSMFSSPKNFLMGAAAIAGVTALTVATGGAITPLLVAGGVVAGGIQVANGASRAANATTDEEAREAWEGIGAGAGSIALSAASAKGALKAAGVSGAEDMGVVEATINCFKQSPKAIVKSVGTFTSGEAVANLKAFVGSESTTKFDAEKELKAREEAKAAFEKNAEKAQQKYNQYFEDQLSHKSAEESAQFFEEQTKLYNENTKNSPQAEIYKEADSIKLTEEQLKARGNAQVEKFNNKISDENLQNIVDNFDKRIANKQAALNKKGLKTDAGLKSLKQQREMYAKLLSESNQAATNR